MQTSVTSGLESSGSNARRVNRKADTSLVPGDWTTACGPGGRETAATGAATLGCVDAWAEAAAGVTAQEIGG